MTEKEEKVADFLLGRIESVKDDDRLVAALAYKDFLTACSLRPTLTEYVHECKKCGERAIIRHRSFGAKDEVEKVRLAMAANAIKEALSLQVMDVLGNEKYAPPEKVAAK